MRNYVLVVILCGFTVRSYLSQDSQVYTFYAAQPFDNVVQVSGFQGDQVPPGAGVQGPYAVSNVQEVPPQERTHNEFRTQIPRQAEFEAQPLPSRPQTRNRNELYTQGPPLDKVGEGLYVLTHLPPQGGNQNEPYSQIPRQTVFEVQSSDKVSQAPYGFSNVQQGPLQPPQQAEYEIRQEARDPTQSQHTNATVNGPNVVRVIYVKNGQQDPVSEIIQQIIGPQSNVLPSENAQSFRIQRPSNDVPQQQQQGYVVPVSQQTLPDSGRKQDQRLPQYQNLVVPASEYAQRQDQQSERLTSIQNTPAIQNILPSENGQSLRIQRPSNQFQIILQQDQGYSVPVSQQTLEGSELNNRRQDQRLPQYQNLVVPTSEYVQRQNQQSERLTSIQKTPLLSNNDQFQASPQQQQGYTVSVSQQPSQASDQRQDQQRLPQYQYLVVPSSDYTQQVVAPQYQAPQDRDRDRYNVIQVSNKPQASGAVLRSKAPQNVNITINRQDLHQQGDYQQLSTFGNLQNATKLTEHTAAPTKKPFYINRFAADLYITKKPCEICCKDDELRPCTSCCNATALLNAKTLKTVLG